MGKNIPNSISTLRQEHLQIGWTLGTGVRLRESKTRKEQSHAARARVATPEAHIPENEISRCLLPGKINRWSEVAFLEFWHFLSEFLDSERIVRLEMLHTDRLKLYCWSNPAKTVQKQSRLIGISRSPELKSTGTGIFLLSILSEFRISSQQTGQMVLQAFRWT